MNFGFALDSAQIENRIQLHFDRSFVRIGDGQASGIMDTKLNQFRSRVWKRIENPQSPETEFIKIIILKIKNSRYFTIFQRDNFVRRRRVVTRHLLAPLKFLTVAAV